MKVIEGEGAGIAEPRERFFENLKEWLRPKEVAELLGLSVRTIHDWYQRPYKSKAPQGLIVKFNHKLYVRTRVLEAWISSQNQR